MKTILLISLLISYSLGNKLFDELEEGSRDCQVLEASPDDLIAYIGWPYKVSCGLVFSDHLAAQIYENVSFDDSAPTTCYIINEEKQLIYNKSDTFSHFLFGEHGVTLPDLNKKSKLNFIIKLEILKYNKCYQMPIRLNLTELPHETCEAFMARHASLYVPRSRINQRKVVPCLLFESVKPKLFVDFSGPNTTAKWLRNCSTLPSGVQKGERNDLNIRNLEYEHAGVYVCAVEHNGMTRYVTTTKICLQPANTITRAIIRCDNNRYSSAVGKNLTVNCVVNMGEIRFFKIFWSRLGEINSTCTPDTSRASSKHVSCTYSTIKRSCFLHVASKKERKPNPFVVSVRFSFTNLTKSDFTTYTIYAPSRNPNENVMKTTFVLMKEDSLKLDAGHVTAIALVSLLVVLVVVAIVVIVVKCKRTYYKM